MTYEELRAEFTSYSFKKKLIDSLGNTCANCGCSGQVIYHHIVPLISGGTNKLTNIAPLCQVCYSKVHSRKVAKNYGCGRPRKAEYEHIKDILDDYFNCKIGKARAVELVGLSPKNKSSWYEIIEKYKEENNVSSYRNNIDVIMSNKVILANETSKLSDDRVLGFIRYKDGRRLRFTKKGTIMD